MGQVLQNRGHRFARYADHIGNFLVSQRKIDFDEGVVFSTEQMTLDT